MDIATAVKGGIAIATLIGGFVIVTIYAFKGQTVPESVLILISNLTVAVISYYFGAHNGRVDGLVQATQSLAQTTTTLAAGSIERRTLAFQQRASDQQPTAPTPPSAVTNIINQPPTQPPSNA